MSLREICRFGENGSSTLNWTAARDCCSCGAMAACWPSKPKVAGSSPARSVELSFQFYFFFLWVLFRRFSLSFPTFEFHTHTHTLSLSWLLALGVFLLIANRLVFVGLSSRKSQICITGTDTTRKSKEFKHQQRKKAGKQKNSFGCKLGKEDFKALHNKQTRNK